MQPDGPEIVLDLIEAFRRSKTLFAAVSLGLFDLLSQSPSSAADLARETSTHPDALARLLDACTSLGLLTRHGDLYQNTPAASRYLTRSSPDTLAGYILYSNDVLFPMWARLENALRENSHRWTDTFGLDGPLFNHFFRTTEARRTFLSGMHGFGLLSSPSIVRIFNLNAFRHLADLGGGTGHLAIAACERYANLHATVFDLPGALDLAREHISRSPAAARLSTTEGDFFSDPLPPADLYSLGRILHDWNEDKIQRLLQRIFLALPPGGGLLIAETLLDDDHSGPVSAHMQSLNMLVCTEGRERSETQYRDLLLSAGFSRIEARRTGAPLDAILARKPE